MSTIDDELRSAAEGVLLVERAFTTLKVSGNDRKSWLNGMVTQDLAPLEAGAAALGISVAKTGKIEAEVAMLLGDDDLWMGVPSDRAERLRDKLDRHLIMEDATIEVSNEPPIWTFAFGPRAREALEVARSNGARGGVTRRGGLEVLVFAEAAGGGARDAILEKIEPSKLASLPGWDRFRVEKGIAEPGPDYVLDESYPQEAALERDEVSFEKGCYLGQEAVFMLEKRGHVQKRLVQLELETPVAAGVELLDGEGKSVGRVTTVAASLALGVVKYKHAREGRELDAGGVKARVTSLLAIPTSD